MTNKRIALISTIVLLVVVIGWQLTLFSAHASPRPAARLVQNSAPPSDPIPSTWEYKILVFPSSAASRRSLGYGGPIGKAPPNLEDEINKLAEQGFVVESFQLNSGYGAGSYGYPGTPDIAALLKRAKK